MDAHVLVWSVGRWMRLACKDEIQFVYCLRSSPSWELTNIVAFVTAAVSPLVHDLCTYKKTIYWKSRPKTLTLLLLFAAAFCWSCCCSCRYCCHLSDICWDVSSPSNFKHSTVMIFQRFVLLCFAGLYRFKSFFLPTFICYRFDRQDPQKRLT
jgi:hypothetical protein